MNAIWSGALRPPLVINMDETAILRHPSGVKGTVLRSVPGSKARRATDRATLAERRSSVTLLATICHDQAVQLKLPQIVLGNEHQIGVGVLRRLQGSLPDNVYIWRAKSAWNCHAVMKRYLSLLAECLGETLREREVVLLVDVNRAHIDHSLLLHARRLSLRMCFVPAKMTRWLQPADVALFGRLKAALRNAWRTRKSALPMGVLSQEEWLRVIASTLADLLPNTHWFKAFDAVGSLGHQRGVSETFCEELGLERPPTVPAGFPTADEARQVFPAGMKVEVLTWVHFVTKATLKGLGKSKPALLSAAAAKPMAKGRALPSPTASDHMYRGRPVRTLN